MNLAKRYREQAEWARTNAGKAASPELRRQWLDLARQYELLAAQEGKPAET
jgi:hypothetical protein